jgi:hypothetical protein
MVFILGWRGYERAAGAAVQVCARRAVACSCTRGNTAQLCGSVDRLQPARQPSPPPQLPLPSFLAVEDITLGGISLLDAEHLDVHIKNKFFTMGDVPTRVAGMKVGFVWGGAVWSQEGRSAAVRRREKQGAATSEPTDANRPCSYSCIQVYTTTEDSCILEMPIIWGSNAVFDVGVYLKIGPFRVLVPTHVSRSWPRSLHPTAPCHPPTDPPTHAPTHPPPTPPPNKSNLPPRNLINPNPPPPPRSPTSSSSCSPASPSTASTPSPASGGPT